MKAIEVTEYGGPEALSETDRDRPDPGPDEVLIDVRAAGINFADVMQRRGLYPGGPEPPYVPGLEAAGRVADAGENADYEVGERVVAMTSGGGYAEYATADRRSCFPIPGEMSTKAATGFPIQFMTAHCCLFGWGGLEPDERVLIHAAAGGVGTAAVQLASQADAEVFGTASTPEKLDLATDLGVDHPINYEQADFRDRIEEITGGEGVDLVLDGVGGEVFDHSVEALSHFGRVVTFGVASGHPAQADTTRVFFGNHSVIGFHLGQALRHDADRVLEAVPDLRGGLASGDLEVVVGNEFPLAEAADAHRHVEDRASVGKIVLLP